MITITQQKEYFKKILQEFAKIEEKNDIPYTYYCHTEHHSNVNKFEALSNSNKIVVKSKLNAKYMPIIIGIFNNIYENNYWRLSRNNENGTLYYTIDDFRLSIDELTKTFSNDLHDEMASLDIYTNQYTIKTNTNNNQKVVYCERIFDEVPIIDDEYLYDSNIEQKVYTLTDIINLIV